MASSVLTWLHGSEAWGATEVDAAFMAGEGYKLSQSINLEISQTQVPAVCGWPAVLTIPSQYGVVVPSACIRKLAMLVQRL